jgi:hypothetical protein
MEDGKGTVGQKIHIPEMGERRMLQNSIHVMPFQSIGNVAAKESSTISAHQFEHHIFQMCRANA